MKTNLFRKLSVPLGGFVVLSLLLTLAVPRAVHAVVAAMVQVVNTASNPAITQDTSKQASLIVNLECAFDGGTANCFQIDEHGRSNFTTQYVVPASLHLVVTSLVLDAIPPFPLNCQVSIFDRVVGKFDSDFQDLAFTNFSNSLSILFTPGIVIAGGAQPGLSGGCNGTGFNEPLYFLHGYLTAN